MAATDMYVTTTGAGVKSGATWATAMSLAEFKTDLEGTSEAGDRYFFQEGTYTLASNIQSLRAGSVDALIEIIGVVSATTAEPPTSSDWATGNNRPLFVHNSNIFYFYTYTLVRNIRATTSGIYNGIDLGGYSFAINCSFTNTNAASTNKALSISTNGVVSDCELTCTNGIGLGNSGQLTAVGNYVHDCGAKGITSGAVNNLFHNIIDTCGIGIELAYPISVVNNTIYNCTTGLLDANYHHVFLLNNTISSCTDGFKSDNAGVVNTSFILDYNNWHGNTRDMSWDNGSTENNSAKGPNDTANAPSFTDAAGGDFSLQSSSSLIDAGFSIELGVS